MVRREGTAYPVIIKCTCPGQESLPERSKCLPLELESYFYEDAYNKTNVWKNQQEQWIFYLSWEPRREVSYGQRDLFWELKFLVLRHSPWNISPPWVDSSFYESRECGYSLYVYRSCIPGPQLYQWDNPGNTWGRTRLMLMTHLSGNRGSWAVRLTETPAVTLNQQSPFPFFGHPAL